MKFLNLVLALLTLSTPVFGQGDPAPYIKGQSSTGLGNQASTVLVPGNQSTKINAYQALVETGNLNKLINPGFEHGTYNTGWTSAVTGTATKTESAELPSPFDLGKKAYKVICAGGASGGKCTVTQDVTTLAAIQGQAGFYVKSDTINVVKVFNRANGANVFSTDVINTDAAPYFFPAVMGTTSSGVQVEITVAASQTVTVFLDEGRVSTADPFQNISNVTGWTTISAPSLLATVSNPTKGTVNKDQLSWRLVGNVMEFQYAYYQTGAGSAGSGFYLLRMPTGYTPDLSLVPTASGTSLNTAGTCKIGTTSVNSGSATPNCTIVYDSSGNLYFSFADVTASLTLTPESTTMWGSARYPVTGSTLAVTGTGRIPVIGPGAQSSVSTLFTNNQDTNWAACTFSTLAWQGVGTVTSSLLCRRHGTNLLMRGNVTLGTVTATPGQINLPLWNGVQLNTITNNPGMATSAGSILRVNGSANTVKDASVFFYSGGFPNLNISGLEYVPAINPLSNGVGASSVYSTGDSIDINVSVPIDGWKANPVATANIKEAVYTYGTTGVDIQSAYFGGATTNSVCTTGTCAMSNLLGSKITSITWLATGAYQVNGIDGTKYTCHGAGFNGTGFNPIGTDKGAGTSTYVVLMTGSNIAYSNVGYASITCIGLP